MSRIFLIIAFAFLAISTEMGQVVFAAMVGMEYEPAQDLGSAVTSVFFVGLAIYAKID